MFIRVIVLRDTHTHMDNSFHPLGPQKKKNLSRFKVLPGTRVSIAYSLDGKFAKKLVVRLKLITLEIISQEIIILEIPHIDLQTIR